MKPPIYVIGYPKSGVTWITRLLGDVLSCPTGGSHVAEDDVEIATEGANRQGPYIVRKGHLMPDANAVTINVPRTLGMPMQVIETSKVIFVIRDPRDIIVSGSFYSRTELKEYALQVMEGTGHMRGVGSWDAYVQKWLNYNDGIFIVRYEDMLDNWETTLLMTVSYLEYIIPWDSIAAAYDRQRFENRVRHIQNHGDSYVFGKDFNLRFMRNGKAGDWKNYIGRYLGRAIEISLGNTMRLLGYTNSRFWWKALP